MCGRAPPAADNRIGRRNITQFAWLLILNGGRSTHVKSNKGARGRTSYRWIIYSTRAAPKIPGQVVSAARWAATDLTSVSR